MKEEPTEDEAALLDRLAKRVVSLRMTAPAVFMLESMRPMNFVASQAMLFFAPIVRGFFGPPDYDRIQTILERRECVDWLVDRIEREEDAFEQRSR